MVQHVTYESGINVDKIILRVLAKDDQESSKTQSELTHSVKVKTSAGKYIYSSTVLDYFYFAWFTATYSSTCHRETL